MSAVESQVSVTVRGTPGDEAGRPEGFLQGMPFLCFFLHALLRFTFELAAWAGSLAACTGEAATRHATASATLAAVGTPKRPPQAIGATVWLVSPRCISTCPHGKWEFSSA